MFSCGVLVKNWPAAMQLLVVGFYIAFSMLIPTLIMAFGVFRMLQPFLQEAKREGKQEQLHGPSRILVKLASVKKTKDQEQNNDD
jgi:hypothetical protein